jgi:hypothetical protein
LPLDVPNGITRAEAEVSKRIFARAAEVRDKAAQLFGLLPKIIIRSS